MNNISVCMTTHNGEKYLRPQLESILAQLEDGDELLISDDNSHDHSLDIVRSYRDTRIRILPSRKFRDPSKNFEYVLQHARHALIFPSDQDDYWYPTKLREMKTSLDSADLVYCNSRLVFENNAKPPQPFITLPNPTGLISNLLKSSYMGCSMAFHRKVLDKALPFPHNGVMYDQWIGLIAERHFKVRYLNQVLMDHRRHETNYTTTGVKSRNSLKRKLQLRFLLLKNLFSH